MVRYARHGGAGARGVLAGVLALALWLLAPSHAAGQGAVPEVRFTVEGFTVRGENPISERETREILAPFTGEQTGLEALQQAARTLEQAIRARGYAFHRVIIPPQSAEAGVIALEVLAFRLDRIEVTGNEHFSDENVRRSLPGLVPGESVPSSGSLARSMQVANDHPIKRIRVTMRQSERPDHLDALVDVVDEKPARFFAAFNNRGTDETGDYRVSLGFQHTNLFDLDHVFTGNYITSPDNVSNVTLVGAFYRIPLYRLGGAIDMRGVFSDVDSGVVGGAFEVSGSGRFFGATYTQALPAVDRYRHRLAFSIDDRFFDNEILFGVLPIGVDVRSRPLAFTYSGEWPTGAGLARIGASYAHNVPAGSDNDSRAYTAARFGASSSWDAVRYNARLDHDVFPGWTLVGRLQGQFAGEPLIPGEQFGLGGMFSVRGFEEREVTGDDATFASVEIRTPPVLEGLRFLGFLEAGRATFRDALPGQKSSETIASAGLGLRYQWRRTLSVDLSFGHVIEGALRTRSGDNKAHVEVLLVF